MGRDKYVNARVVFGHCGLFNVLDALAHFLHCPTLA